ncbi:MAG TPA: hypothetical protein VGP25_01590 [Gemmatimonadaceae bacterium]|jgi:hypothetical protein|nr:hypothetical protein [Gemmatimonadaceae bacterium]
MCDRQDAQGEPFARTDSLHRATVFATSVRDTGAVPGNEPVATSSDATALTPRSRVPTDSGVIGRLDLRDRPTALDGSDGVDLQRMLVTHCAAVYAEHLDTPPPFCGMTSWRARGTVAHRTGATTAMYDLELVWIARTAFERNMDDIAGALSAAEVEYLRAEVQRDFASHPRLTELEHMLDAQQHRLTTDGRTFLRPGG